MNRKDIVDRVAGEAHRLQTSLGLMLENLAPNRWVHYPGSSTSINHLGGRKALSHSCDAELLRPGLSEDVMV